MTSTSSGFMIMISFRQSSSMSEHASSCSSSSPGSISVMFSRATLVRQVMCLNVTVRSLPHLSSRLRKPWPVTCAVRVSVRLDRLGQRSATARSPASSIRKHDSSCSLAALAASPSVRHCRSRRQRRSACPSACRRT